MTVKGQRDVIARLVASQTPNKYSYLGYAKNYTTNKIQWHGV